MNSGKILSIPAALPFFVEPNALLISSSEKYSISIVGWSAVVFLSQFRQSRLLSAKNRCLVNKHDRHFTVLCGKISIG